tara:strand:+ start:2238 stop:2456 length:219 start_codon:yes stop_codon:yes gene_type:complete
MITFEANTPQEKWIKKHFNSKAELIRATKLSRPTIDKMCKDSELFFKYIPLFAHITKQSKDKVVQQMFNYAL